MDAIHVTMVDNITESNIPWHLLSQHGVGVTQITFGIIH